MSDNCPACLNPEERPNPSYDKPVVAYQCSACGHHWTTSRLHTAYPDTRREERGRAA
jgi:transposase-like protein